MFGTKFNMFTLICCILKLISAFTLSLDAALMTDKKLSVEM